MVNTKCIIHVKVITKTIRPYLKLESLLILILNSVETRKLKEHFFKLLLKYEVIFETHNAYIFFSLLTGF